jgi:hypothetical protein
LAWPRGPDQGQRQQGAAGAGQEASARDLVRSSSMIAHRPLPAIAHPGWPGAATVANAADRQRRRPVTGDYVFVRGVFPGEVAR